MAVQVSAAGGLGFIGPPAKIGDAASDLTKATELVAASSSQVLQSHQAESGTLPVGIGFQTWATDLQEALMTLERNKPCAVWLFAPRNGQKELDEWVDELRKLVPGCQIWIQVGTLEEAISAAESQSAPDVLVVQGAEAGGHGRATDGMGIQALLPEIADAIAKTNIPIIAAGGIVDGRGLAAALSLGAAGGAMGTRFLAAKEARISPGYQNEVLRVRDAAKNTVRTHLYNHLRGTYGWPEQFAPRTVINKSWIEHETGVAFEELKRRHDAASSSGQGWGPDGRLATYVGAAVGLVREVKPAGSIVSDVRDQTRQIFKAMMDNE